MGLVTPRWPSHRQRDAGLSGTVRRDLSHKRINQSHNKGIAPRTETTINNTTDFEIGKRFLSPPRGARSVGFMKEKGMRGVALSLRQNATVCGRHHERATLLIPSIRAPIPPE
jgi:hypothetical protein